ncbi:MAG: ribosomal protein S18-alanine N-acetyltransferase [Peptococcaceae bacterium]|nr:ribosomal protein S18-alanine N-acetyltransferase [Peptococcaceae bacterium]
MKIREALSADIVALVQLEQACFAGAAWGETAVEAVIQSTYRHAFVLENAAGRAVGYVILQVVLDEGEIERIGILPDHRGQGLGKYLLATVMERRQLARCFLEVRENNRDAKALYASLGFVTCGRRSGYYIDGTDAIMMRWERDNNEETK